MATDKTRLYFLSHGTIENDVAVNVLLHNQATADDPHKAADWIRVPVMSALIEHPKLGWILVDTGSHRDAMNGVWPEDTRRATPLTRTPDDLLEARLSQLNLTPADIDWLVLTHMHLDHAGELHLFQGTNAGQRVIVHEVELKQALYEVYRQDEAIARAYLRSDFVGLSGIRYETVQGDTPLADDLELLWLPGHTAGLLGFMIHLENSGTFIFMGDAAYLAANYGPPARLPGFIHDSVACLQTYEKVRWLERRHDATVIFGHDPEQFASLKHSPEYYD